LIEIVLVSNEKFPLHLNEHFRKVWPPRRL